MLELFKATRRKSLVIFCFLYASSTSINLVRSSVDSDEDINLRDTNQIYEENDIMIKQNANFMEPNIPQTLIFTHEENVLKTKQPGEVLYNNVQNTINKYSEAWNEINGPRNVNVRFLTDIRCHRIIKTVYPQLLRHFERENRGSNRADICRIAALYMHGGYYFDVDIETVTPFLVPPDKSFVTVKAPFEKFFFQAFIAAKAGHPILRQALRLMEMHYDETLQRNVRDLVGPYTLKWAFDSFHPEETGDVFLLKEISLNIRHWQNTYPSFPRQKGYGCCCNYVVHDSLQKVIYFLSRTLDFSDKCSSTPVD